MFCTAEYIYGKNKIRDCNTFDAPLADHYKAFNTWSSKNKKTKQLDICNGVSSTMASSVLQIAIQLFTQNVGPVISS